MKRKYHQYNLWRHAKMWVHYMTFVDAYAAIDKSHPDSCGSKTKLTARRYVII